MSFNISELALIAKRENNNKRKYLIVNPLQGKHMPVSPSKAAGLFDQLSQKIKDHVKCWEGRTLVISFAETATAIGAFAAFEIKSDFYIQTTREDLKGDYIDFVEAHSHATEQKLYLKGLKDILGKVENIIFVEDEITTGSTILRLVERLLQISGSKKFKFAAASILNGMSAENIEKFKTFGIDVVYVNKILNSGFEELLDSYEYLEADNKVSCLEAEKTEFFECKGYVNPRYAVNSLSYGNICQKIAEDFVEKYSVENCDSLLVLGTEEFMYPALITALEFEKKNRGLNVKFHATTRSPILAGLSKGYPIFLRREIRSPYNIERVTYVYNLVKYDRVIIATDAETKNSYGIGTIIGALTEAGCKNIDVCGWVDR